MKKDNKIEVSWIMGVPIYYEIDFGLFKAHRKNKVWVDKDFWRNYCDARLKFEIMQKDLFDKINRRVRPE